MYILPAIDLYEHKAVRLFKGDYSQMTVYSENPAEVAKIFKESGAEYIHMVDLEGARDGNMPNFDIVADIARTSGLKVEIGGGIRSAEAVKKYMDAGVSRVILGTAAVTDEKFLKEMVSLYGERIVVGADIKDGYVAIKGWLEKSELDIMGFCRKMQGIGVKTIIVTDISKDGAMQGTNRNLYGELKAEFDMDIIASGGVSSIEDIRALKELGAAGAIIGKAYYTGAIDLKEAIEESR